MNTHTERWWQDGALIRMEVNGRNIEITDEIRKKHVLPKVKEQSWPLILIPLKLMSIPSDKGLGDIIERTIGPLGGDKFKAWYQITFGRPCGCSTRKENWNNRYPLKP